MSVNQTISFNNKKNTFWLLLITFVLVGPKWIFSFTLLPEEDFLLKVIHETVDIFDPSRFLRIKEITKNDINIS